jgi:hypothetical protein
MQRFSFLGDGRGTRAKCALGPFWVLPCATHVSPDNTDSVLLDQPHPRSSERTERRRLLDTFDLVAAVAVA